MVTGDIGYRGYWLLKSVYREFSLVYFAMPFLKLKRSPFIMKLSWKRPQDLLKG
jgi:hypothetical protein